MRVSVRDRFPFPKPSNAHRAPTRPSTQQKDEAQVCVTAAKKKMDNAIAELRSLLRQVVRSNNDVSFRKPKVNNAMSLMMEYRGINDETQEVFFNILQRTFFEPGGIDEVSRDGVMWVCVRTCVDKIYNVLCCYGRDGSLFSSNDLGSPTFTS